MKKVVFAFALMFGITALGQDPDSDILLYYKFDNDVLDTSKNAYHGTLMGPTFVEDRFGNPNGAINFDGIDDYVILPNVTDLKPPLPVSFSFWIRYESADYSNNAVFNTSYEDERSSGIYFNAQMSTGNFAVNYGDGSPFYNPTARRTFVSTRRIEPFIWTHVAVIVRGATDMDIYINCSPYNGNYSGTGGALVYSDTPGNIGRRDRDLGVPPLYFKGQLDDFRYYDRELSVAEIEMLCETLSIPNLVQQEGVVPSLLLFPNPVTDYLNFEPKNGTVEQIEIFNALGQRVYKGPFTSALDVSYLTGGMYVVKSIGDQGVSSVWFVKQ